MRSVAEPPTLVRNEAVAKKRTDGDSEPKGGRPVNFRAPPDLAADLDYIAEALGLDVSNLVRMILRENIKPYRGRADRIKAAKQEGD